MSEGGLTFNRRAVRPMQCLREGWRLIKDDYWLFLGITFVGSLLGSVAMGVLRGPATCGIHICFFRREAGQRVTFDLLLKGFDYFVQSLIATLLMTVPVILLLVPAYFVLIIGMVVAMPTATAQSQGQPPDPSAFFFVMALYAALLSLAVLVALLFGALFLFVYPLIVDRGLSGIAAMKLSARAALGNPGGVLGIMFLMFLLGLVGALLCYVGLIFITPLYFAMIAVAYRQVFPAEGSVLVFDQPSPPSNWPDAGEWFRGTDQTGVQQPVEGPLTVTAATPPPLEPGTQRTDGAPAP
jgi:hypothetical protein